MSATNKGVPGIPLGALDAIQDENTRQVLRAIVDGWHVRNGASGNGDSRFITAAELGTVQSSVVSLGNQISAQQQDQQAGGFIKPGDISRVINDLQAQVMESLLFRQLGERVNLIDKPGGIFDRVGATELVLRNEITQRVNGDTALSTSLSTMGTRVGNAETAIQTETSQRVNADNALQTTITTQYASVNSSLALQQSAITTNANNVSALTTQLNQIQASVGSNSTAIAQETEARVNADGTMLGKYSVKVDQNGYVSGFGLLSAANNSTPFSEFIFRADRFSIASPTGPSIPPRIPFIVTTTPDANGNDPGVYMDMAVMKKASITKALIGDAEIDTLRIAGNSVTVPVGLTGYGNDVGVFVYMPYGGKIFVSYNTNVLAYNGSEASLYAQIFCDGVPSAQTGVSLGFAYSGACTAVGIFDVGPGMHSIYGATAVTIGQRTLGATAIYAVGCMR